MTKNQWGSNNAMWKGGLRESLCLNCEKVIRAQPTYKRKYCSRACRDAYKTTPYLVMERYWEKVKVGKPYECWLWTGHTNNMGYGIVRIKQDDYLVHRVSWNIHHGVIPDGLFVLHKCDTPLCINPNHLFTGTSQDNVRDMIAKGRHPTLGKKGESSRYSRLTEVMVLGIRADKTNGVKRSEILEKYNIRGGHYHQIVNREIWTHI